MRLGKTRRAWGDEDERAAFLKLRNRCSELLAADPGGMLNARKRENV